MQYIQQKCKFNHLLYQENVTRKYLVVLLRFEMMTDSVGEERGPIKITANPHWEHNFMLKTPQILYSQAEVHHKDIGN